MSRGGGASGRGEHPRRLPHYDQVSPGSLPRSESLQLLSTNPPPLPERLPVGPEFDSGGSEEDQDLDKETDQQPNPTLHIKPVHRFIPDSWKNFFRGSSKAWSMPSSPGSNNNNNSSPGVRCSPPHSPSAYGGSARSYDSRKELLEGRDGLKAPSGRTYRTGLSYSERVEEYHQRYTYMKSWAGLLRIMGCVELLLGAAVFACVCAYIHKDNEWFNMFGYSSPGGAYGGGFYGAGAGGSYYSGPKTPFVLVVAGLAWLVTVMVLVLGMTMYYRTILLDSNWWPLTEFCINLALAVLYMAAGIVYVRDTTRGGLCSYPVFNNGINGMFCRTEAGQTAAIIFLFITMVIYLISAMVALKLWRHEAARRDRQSNSQAAVPGSPPKPPQQERGSSVVPIVSAPAAIPAGHIPKPVIMPDYIAKYPTIRSPEERERCRAVFNDQYAEYRDLHRDVQAAVCRFQEMDTMMLSLPRQPSSQTEAERINRILQDYQRKKNDPTFLEKKERCEYLKSKLSHIKQKIQEYDKVMEWNDGSS